MRGRLHPAPDRWAARSTRWSIRAASVRWCWAGSAGGVVVASETCALDLVGRLDGLRAAAGPVPQDRRRPHHRAAPAPAPAREPLRLRAGLLRPAGQPDLRRVGGPGAARAGPAAGPGAPRARRRGGLQRARQLQRHGARASPRSLGHQARERPDPEPLRRPHLHQSDPGAPGGQGEDQVQPGARGDRGQVGGDGGRQPGAGHHQQGAGADDPRRRGPRGAPPARQPADHRPLPLRHRHPDPGRADRRHPLHRGDPRVPRRGFAGLPLPRWHAPCCGRRGASSVTPASRASIRPTSRTTW